MCCGAEGLHGSDEVVERVPDCRTSDHARPRVELGRVPRVARLVAGVALRHKHGVRDEVAGALWHLLLASTYAVCVVFHTFSAWMHWRDAK